MGLSFVDRSETCLMSICILDCLATKGDCELVEVWFQKMVDAGIRPCAISFNSMLEPFSKHSDSSGCIKWFNRMLEMNVTPNVVSFNFCLHVFAKNGQVDQVNEWFRKMDDFKISPSIANYNVVIDALSQINDHEGVKKVCEIMQKRGIQPNMITMKTAMTAFKTNEAPEVDDF